MSDAKERLAELRAAKEGREKAAREAAEARELETLELEERFTKELGPRGSHFEMVETIDGPIVVKLGEGVLHTRFQATAAKDLNEVALHDYVFPCVVHPAKDVYLKMVAQRPGIALRCASALTSLYGAKDAADTGKY